ncbi:hypothetical protein LOZ58_001483 [Ophidiomyces ophidiicola]|nr:hypothetical protein LOZ58_001483 [Ophidiomyces ophidiicola]
MNPASFPGPGGPGGVTGLSDKPKMDNTQILLKHVSQTIHAQGPFDGWRSEVQINTRVVKVGQMISSLRLIPGIEVTQAISAALTFEEKAFREAKDLASYENACNEKLVQLRDKRQEAAMTQSGAQAVGAQPQNQMQHMFPAGMQRPNQGPPMSLQHPSMNMPSQQPMRQQPFFQNPEMQAVPGQIRGDIQAKEYQHVCQLAEQMAQNTSPADLEKIKVSLERMSAVQRQNLESKGVSPLQYFFRCQALKSYRKFKQGQMIPNPQNFNTDPTKSAENGMLAAHQRQMNQTGMPFQGSPAMRMAGLDPTFTGNVDHIQAQQMSPFRSQDAGQPTIPAPASQVMNQPQFGGQQGSFQTVPYNINRANLNAMMAQHQQRQSLQVPPGGVGAQGRAYQRPPTMAQNHTVMPTQRPVPQNLPPALQAQLAHLPPEQVNLALQNYRRSLANSHGMLRPPQNVPGAQPPLPDSGQLSQPPGAALLNDPNMRAQIGMSHPMANMAGIQPPPAIQGPQFSIQKPNQQSAYPQPPDPRLQYLQQRSGPFNMSEDQVREMDRLPFPFAMLNSYPSMAQTMPKTLKTWGQLKMWVSKNPQAPGEITMDRLVMLQKLHFSQLVQARREAVNRAIGQPGATPIATDHNNLQPPLFNAQGPQPQQFPNQAQQHPQVRMMRPPTATDIQIARQRLGAQAVNLTDEDVRIFIQKYRQQKSIMLQAAQTREAALNAQVTNQAPLPTQVSVPNPSPQHIPTSHPLPQASQPTPTPVVQTIPTMDAKSAAHNAPNSTRPSVPKPSPNNLKRPSGSESENPAMKTTAAPQPHIPAPPPTVTQPPQATPPQPVPLTQPTREQLASMTAQHRAQWETHMRRQKSQTRQGITKEAADEAWARLPDHLKQIYAEVVRNDSATTPVPMATDRKASVGQSLRDNTDMLSRMDALVQWVSKYPNQQRPLRTLLQMRMLLMKQFKGPDWTLAENFTITDDYLATAIGYIKKWFSEMINRVQISRQNQTRAAPGAQPPSTPVMPATQNAPAPLNASNLKQFEQQQEAALQRTRNTSQAPAQAVPPAPTTMQPPFPLGATSPQGVPRVYGPTNVTQDTLTLPPPKKRKPNPPSNKAAAKAGQAQPLATKEGSPTITETKKPAAVPKETFKCSVMECTYRLGGFPSKAALDAHVKTEHKPEEQITNPLEYAIESYKIGLGLDKIDKKPPETQKPKLNAVSVPPGKLPPSKPGGVKIEAVTPASQQMAQSASIAGIKPNSPAHPQHKPPQVTPGKGQDMATSKPEVEKDGKKDAISNTVVPQDAVKDPWEECPTSLDSIRSTFGDLAKMSYFNASCDPLDELLLSNAFNTAQSKDTPQSTDASALSQTPQDSDTSDMDIQMERTFDDTWLPTEWVALPASFDGSLNMGETFPEIDWSLHFNDVPLEPFFSQDALLSV